MRPGAARLVAAVLVDRPPRLLRHRRLQQWLPRHRRLLPPLRLQLLQHGDLRGPVVVVLDVVVLAAVDLDEVVVLVLVLLVGAALVGPPVVAPPPHPPLLQQPHLRLHGRRQLVAFLSRTRPCSRRPSLNR